MTTPKEEDKSEDVDMCKDIYTIKTILILNNFYYTHGKLIIVSV